MVHSDSTTQVALVTGAAGGIGRAIALALAGQGWQLLITDRDTEALQGTRQHCLELGHVVISAALDVTSEDAVAAAVKQVVAHYGHLDGFVSSAGVSGVVQPIVNYPADVFMQTLAINTTGTFLCLKHALPALRASGGGSFVAIGSTSSIRGRAGLSAYVASKHAVLGLVRSAALETVGTRVRVNAVLPGPTQTAMIDSINAMASRGDPGSGGVQRAVSAPYGQPEDVASTVTFLMSSAARHINGAALVVDGGSTLA